MSEAHAGAHLVALQVLQIVHATSYVTQELSREDPHLQLGAGSLQLIKTLVGQVLSLQQLLLSSSQVLVQKSNGVLQTHAHESETHNATVFASLRSVISIIVVSRTHM